MCRWPEAALPWVFNLRKAIIPTMEVLENSAKAVPKPDILQRAIAGCLLGTAVGDALGLPVEGLSRARQRRLFGAITSYRFLFGRGMVSDDTEHAVLVAQALIASGGDPDLFRAALARRLRVWLLMLPAGIGLATLRAGLKLLVGVPPTRSGVFSAGNGPAMRAALLGVAFPNDPEKLRLLVHHSSRMTHTDPKAELGALAIAVAAQAPGDDPMPILRTVLPSGNADADELLRLLCLASASAARGETTLSFAESMGIAQGVSGYVYETVPVALHAAFRYPNDFRAAILGVIACGGDADTTAAIAGGIVGARVGVDGIPAEWRAGLAEWPCSASWMSRLADRLSGVIADGNSGRPLPVFLPAVALRNLLFVIVVLYHGFRRLFPPY
jgi:ADP-ribosyl-[dinitrogen reductase] hydrolase